MNLFHGANTAKITDDGCRHSLPLFCCVLLTDHSTCTRVANMLDSSQYGDLLGATALWRPAAG